MNRDLLQVGEWFSWPGRSTESIRTWRRFRRDVRNKGERLLQRLAEFDAPILVTGCQRSGTTALARAITQSMGMTNYWFGRDDELDAAMILSGCVPHEPRGRYCFQTTYLNECWREYLHQPKPFQMVWVIRNPRSVVYSMLHNWGRFAFNELFESCGADGLNDLERRRFERFGSLAVPRIRRGCLSYKGKVSQLFSLHETLGPGSVLVLDYDELVTHPQAVLPVVYRFLGVDYQARYGEFFSARSVAKADQFTTVEMEIITSVCEPVFRRAQGLIKQDARFSADFSEPVVHSETTC